MITRILSIASVIFIGIGCASYNETMRNTGHSLGAIQTRDIQQANAYRKMLASHLGLSDGQVRVSPGSGVTNVSVSGITTPGERERITAAIASLNSQNPQLNPLRLSFL
jgi:hypothetical protein